MKEVKAFFKSVRDGETEGLVDEEEQDAMEAMMSMWSKPFMPNLLNTVIFLVETSQIIAVMFVNYKGALKLLLRLLLILLLRFFSACYSFLLWPIN